jgi:hypothetical protein
MTYDFRANQVRLNRIISSGSIPIIIYASSSATDLQGGKNFPDPGSDVFLFVSGSSTAKTLFGGDVVVSGSLTASIVSASQLTGSLQNITTGVPYLVGGTNITLATSSIGQITITSTAASSGGGDVSASYVVMSPTSSLSDNQRVLTAGNGIRLTDSGSPSGSVTLSEAIWIEQTNIFATTTSSIGIKTTEEHTGVDLFISGSDTTGFGANLVLYSDLSNFGLPRLVLSSSSGSLGSLIGYDNDISGLVDGINIDIPSTRNFGFRIGGGTPATTVDSAGNLNVRSGSASTGYFDVVNTIVGIGVATPNAYNASATRLVIKDTDSTGNKYQLFLSNESPSTDLNSGIAFAFGAASISGAIYAKSNTTGDDRKGLNALIPTGNSFSWRTTGAHLGELTGNGNLIISGSVKAYTGFTGSLSGTIGGLPFIIGGPNITASYNSLGQWEITGSSGGGGGDTYWTSTVNNAIYTTGSAAATGLTVSVHGLRVTGSYMQGSSHTVTSPDSNNCFIAGQSNTVNAGSAFVHGYNNTSLANYSHAEGNGGNTINALAAGSHAEGTGNTIHGEAAHAEGQGTTVGYSGFNTFGDYSHTEGNGTQTYGVHSHAEGYQTIAGATTDWFWGEASHAEGANTIALGRGSHAEGRGSIAYGACTHAGGLYTIASGSVSPTEAFSNVNFTQTAYGKYNKRENTTSLFVVGDGTGDSDALRHDILRVESGSVQVTGSLIATGITGSISGTVGGLPFLVAGSNVTASYNGSGQWTISANASGGGSTSPGGLDQQIQFNSGSTFSGSSNLTYNYTTNTLTLTGSLTASTVVAGGVNITPVTASLFVYGDGTNRGSGSISGLFESGSLMAPGTIGKFDVEILAMSYGSQTGASWKYTATALWPYSGNFSFLAATELAAEYGPTAGSYNPAADWDVNFNSLGEIELTGSAPALPSGGTSFYVQVTKKMVATYGTILA